MRFKNPFKLQNWKFRKFLLMVLGIQLFLLGLFALNNLGIDTPIIRPLIGFIYLSFIPGYLLLRILRLHNLSSIESFLYALGLSFFIDYFVGFLINMFYPILGITNKPISEISIVLTMAGVVFLLCIVAYFRDELYCNPDYINLKNILTPQFLFLSLIPFTAIFGSYLVNYYHTNNLLMIMIILIVLIALIIGFTNWIDKKYYPYTIWVIAISLAWHLMLITPYVNNHDGEMWGAKITIENGFWNYNDYGNYNSVLSNKIFTPMVYFTCNIGLTWIYKIIFPLWASIFPIVIYAIVRRYLNYKGAFLSSYITMISGTMAYLSVFTVITKQLMAELFIALIILTVDDNIPNLKKMIIMLLFGSGIIWSHYGTSYLFMIGLIFTLIFLKIYQLINNSEFYNYISKKFLAFAGLYALLVLSWYIFVSGSSLFHSVVDIGSNILGSIWTGFLSPESSRGAYLVSRNTYGLRFISKFMNLGIIFFMSLGLIKALWNHKKLKFDIIYIGLSLYLFVILTAAVLLPHFSVMGPDRLYILALITLSPFCIIGGSCLFKANHNTFAINLKLLYIYTIVLMLLNIGFIGEIIEHKSTSIPLSKYSVDKFGNLDDKAKIYCRYITGYDVHAIKWISNYDKLGCDIYCARGYTSIRYLPENYGDNPSSVKYVDLSPNTKYIKKNSYIWIMYAQIKENIGFTFVPDVGIYDWFNFSEIGGLFKDSNKIYDNGGSQILIS